jgi:multiple sugar transport system permease protein
MISDEDMFMIEAKVVTKKRPKLFSAGHLYVAPAVLLIILMAFYPTLKVFNMSLLKEDKKTDQTEFIGFENYETLIKGPLFGKVVKQTLYFSVNSSIGHIILGFLLALYMNAKLNSRVRGASRAVILLPWALSPIVVAIIAQLWAYPLTSPIADILKTLHLADEFAPLGTPKTALLALTVINVWQYTPFYMLMILAGLQTVDTELYDAAKVDGASFLQRVRYVTIPHVRKLLLTLLLFDLVTTASYFDLIWVTTQGGPVRSTEVLATFIYRIAFWSMDWNKAAALGVILLTLCMLIAAGVVIIMERE